MATTLSKRLEKLEAALASRVQGPKTIRRVVIEAGGNLPTEGPDDLLICRVIVIPPERPADEPLPESTQAVSPRIEHGDRTPIEIQRDAGPGLRDETRFHRRLDYPSLGTF